MSDQENQEGYLEEIKEGTIRGNLHLLEFKLFPQDHLDELAKADEQTKLDLFGIQDKGMFPQENGKFHQEIWITYNTSTGTITPTKGDYQFGDFSRVHVTLVNKQDSNGEIIPEQILLYHPGSMPTPDQFQSAFDETKDTKVPHDRRIKTERIIPGQEKLQGEYEDLGKSQYASNTQGDLIILDTLRKFNQQFRSKE